MISWQHILRTNIRSVEALCHFLELDKKELSSSPHFPINIPLRLVKKMEKGNIRDPLFLQFVSQKKELVKDPSFVKDPVEDKAFRKAPKLLVKYPGRALLVTTGACAMHCRFCFRQHFDYEKGKGFTEELSYIAQDLSLKEVILSGGDPLSLSNTILGEILHELESMKHIRRIRFHSRFLIGIPERIDLGFLELLKKSSKQVFFIIHCNHARELDSDVGAALKRLREQGVVLLNQAVLLKGVNDSIEALEELSENLIDLGVIPYYLHQLDRVEGASHFEVTKERGLELVALLRERTSGFGQFTYVQELPHKKSKTLINHELHFVDNS